MIPNAEEVALKSRPWLAMSIFLGCVPLLFLLYIVTIGPQPSLRNALGTGGFLLLGAYMANFTYHFVYIRRDHVVWRRRTYWGWHRVQLADVEEFMLSPGNGYNVPIIVMFLRDGREVWAGLPSMSDEERDEAFVFFRRAATDNGAVEVQLGTRRG